MDSTNRGLDASPNQQLSRRLERHGRLCVPRAEQLYSSLSPRRLRRSASVDMRLDKLDEQLSRMRTDVDCLLNEREQLGTAPMDVTCHVPHQDQSDWILIKSTVDKAVTNGLSTAHAEMEKLLRQRDAEAELQRKQLHDAVAGEVTFVLSRAADMARIEEMARLRKAQETTLGKYRQDLDSSLKAAEARVHSQVEIALEQISRQIGALSKRLDRLLYELPGNPISTCS